MCGIIGCVGVEDTAGVLLNALKALEYRGYDSAGMALLNGGGFRVAKSLKLTSVLINDDVDTQRWGITALLTRVVSRNADSFLRYSYNEQSSKTRTRGSGTDFGDHLVTVGFQYNFDPIRVW